MFQPPNPNSRNRIMKPCCKNGFYRPLRSFISSARQNLHTSSTTHKKSSNEDPKPNNKASLLSTSLHRRQPSLKEIIFGGRTIYSRSVEEVERAANELLDFVEAKKRKEGQCILGLDIEWKPSFIRGVSPGKAAVMQICGDKNYCHVLHIHHSGIPKNLQSLLEDHASLKVGVNIASDAKKVLVDHNVSIKSLGELSDLANQKLGGDRKTWSLSALAEMLICKKLPKLRSIRLGNWEADGLSKEQLKYAATDAYVSWYLYQVLNNFPDLEVNKAPPLKKKVTKAPK